MANTKKWLWSSHRESNNSNKSFSIFYFYFDWNKANMRDLIAATGLIILLKLDSNHRLFSPCGLEIWQMASKTNRAILLYYVKRCVPFQIHRSRNAQFGSKFVNFLSLPHDLEIWWMNLKYNRAPLLYYIKLCASFQSHGWIQTGVKIRKRSMWVKIDDFVAVWHWNSTDGLEKQ